MSGEGAQSQPKAAPKAPTITSAFINKGAKTFAPKKAVRRRPAAAAAPNSTVPSTSNSTSNVEVAPQTQPQTQADHSPAGEQSEQQIDTATAQLHAPAATQEPPRQLAAPTEQTLSEPPAVAASSSAPGPAVERLPPSTSTADVSTPQLEGDVSSIQSPPRTATSLVATAETESGRSPKRRRSEAPEERQTQQTAPGIAEPLIAVQAETVEDAQPEQSIDTVVEQSADIITGPATNVQPAQDASQPTETPIASAVHSEANIEAAPITESYDTVPENTTAAQATAEPTEARSWNAVNTTVDVEEAPTAKSKPRRPVGRRRRKAVTLRNMDEEAEEDEARRREDGEVEDEYVPTRSRRPSSKRGKRKAADAPEGEVDGTVQPPPEKKRQTRKARAMTPIPAGSGQDVAPGTENETGEITESVQTVENAQDAEIDENSREPTRPTPSRKRKRQSTSQPSGEGEQHLRRKGRPPRAPTPSDAEDEVIDEDNFFMNDLARRNIRIGKLSQREKKMREINWQEVKQRQKEKEAEQMNSRAVHAEMERQAQEKEDAVRTAQEQVRYENVGGEMRIVQGSGQVNYEEIADTRYAEEVVEEDDFTNRITSRSFMRNNKRYPEEFLLPGQGKRWDIRSTQDFYDALRMFGTDFGMMTTLFEGVSRRSLKLKFNREERKQPEVIKEILQQKATRLSNWDDFLKASGKENEQYDRVEQIKLDLEAAEEDARRQIEEAKAEFEEEKRQKRLAGFMSDEEGGENDAGKKKRGKKGKEKHVTFQQDEDGVEVLEVDENDGWGVE